jgi:transposase
VPTLLPVTVRPEMQSPTAQPQQPTLAPARAPTGTIEIEIGNARVRLRGTVDDASVRSVLRALSELA